MVRDVFKLLILATSSAAIATLLALTPRSGEDVIVVFAPWIDAQTIPDRIWRSGGFARDDLAIGVVASSGDERFFANLRRDGALLVLSAKRASALCGFEVRT